MNEHDKMALNKEPTIRNIHDNQHDVKLTSSMDAGAGVTNRTPNSHNPIVDAIEKIHADHMSMLEDALYRIDSILGEYSNR
jgi:hypothetical protein